MCCNGGNSGYKSRRRGQCLKHRQMQVTRKVLNDRLIQQYKKKNIQKYDSYKTIYMILEPFI